MSQHRVHVERLKRSQHLILGDVLLDWRVKANVWCQGLQPKMREWSPLKDQILLSNCHLNAAFKNENEVVDRFTLLKDDRSLVVFLLGLDLYVTHDVLIQQPTENVFRNDVTLERLQCC